jgi:catechol 2,3-dioxygenase-like lactoylglutathione lyase family enzyme
VKIHSLLAAILLASSSFAADSPSRPRIVGLSHLAFYAHELDKTRAFYKDFLGYDEPYSLTNQDGSLHLTWIKINDHQTIELFPEKEAGTDRLYHIAVETDDAEGMRQYLASKGVKVPDKLPLGRIGNGNYFITDPDGHTVEIVEYKPTGWTLKDKGRHLPDSRISDHLKHGGIAVRDLDASLKFYRDILGFKEIWRGSANSRQLSWVHVQVPEGTDFIELMLGNPTPERLGSMHHLCLEVPDIVKASETLKARHLPAGCKLPTEIKTGVNRKRQINYFDPDGTRVELMEPHTVDGQPAPSSTDPPP